MFRSCFAVLVTLVVVLMCSDPNAAFGEEKMRKSESVPLTVSEELILREVIYKKGIAWSMGEGTPEVGRRQVGQDMRVVDLYRKKPGATIAYLLAIVKVGRAAAGCWAAAQALALLVSTTYAVDWADLSSMDFYSSRPPSEWLRDRDRVEKEITEEAAKKGIALTPEPRKK
jgi:hypothetical protein